MISNENGSFSEKGKVLFETLYIYANLQEADSQFKNILLENPVVCLIGQVFYGRGKQSLEQLCALLNYHAVSKRDIGAGEVVSLLTLLNRFGILTYDKKNRQFLMREPACSEAVLPQYYIDPSTPFSNIYNLRKVIRTCKGAVFWIDKHFRKEGFEILLDGLPFEGVSSVTIISGKNNLSQSAKSDYFALKAELSARSITLNWRIITCTDFKWHDRWLLADNQCYNIPPVFAVIRGQRSDILQATERLDKEPFFNVSVALEEMPK